MSVFTPVGSDPAKIKETSAKDYAIRFVGGGVVTALVGIIGATSGPAVAGLFLAFPAILVASLTLLGEKHGRGPAGADAFGARAGSIGLVAFGVVIWQLGSRDPAWVALLLAMVAWTVVSLSVWTFYCWVRREQRPN
jgi:uncharacterized membrane protein (GlpM family)